MSSYHPPVKNGHCGARDEKANIDTAYSTSQNEESHASIDHPQPDLEGSEYNERFAILHYHLIPGLYSVHQKQVRYQGQTDQNGSTVGTVSGPEPYAVSGCERQAFDDQIAHRERLKTALFIGLPARPRDRHEAVSRIMHAQGNGRELRGHDVHVVPGPHGRRAEQPPIDDREGEPADAD